MSASARSSSTNRGREPCGRGDRRQKQEDAKERQGERGWEQRRATRARTRAGVGYTRALRRRAGRARREAKGRGGTTVSRQRSTIAGPSRLAPWRTARAPRPGRTCRPRGWRSRAPRPTTRAPAGSWPQRRWQCPPPGARAMRGRGEAAGRREEGRSAVCAGREGDWAAWQCQFQGRRGTGGQWRCSRFVGKEDACFSRSEICIRESN